MRAADRDGLIGAAEALVFPSEYEGFGAPVLEAMAMGTPVVCSDRVALPEVAGDAALVRPLDPDAWKGALDEIARSHATSWRPPAGSGRRSSRRRHRVPASPTPTAVAPRWVGQGRLCVSNDVVLPLFVLTQNVGGRHPAA